MIQTINIDIIQLVSSANVFYESSDGTDLRNADVQDLHPQLPDDYRDDVDDICSLDDSHNLRG